jgi:hypothetical protein
MEDRLQTVVPWVGGGGSSSMDLIVINDISEITDEPHKAYIQYLGEGVWADDNGICLYE